MLPAFFVLLAMQLVRRAVRGSRCCSPSSLSCSCSAWPSSAASPTRCSARLMPIVVATIALGDPAEEGVRDFYSAEAQPFPTLFADKLFNVAGVTISLANIGTLASRWCLVALQGFLPDAHRPAMQAAAQNPTVASILGVPSSA